RLTLRGLYTNKADDEVLTYTGLDPDAGVFYRRATKLTYVQRAIRYLTLEGQHDLAGALPHSTLDWKFTRSDARRRPPDGREAMYIRVPFDTDPGPWGLAVGGREYGALQEDGWGTTAKLSVPFRAPVLGGGHVRFGFDRQSRQRNNF